MTIIAAINVAKRGLAMEEQDYRSLLERVTGKTSLREMNGPEHVRVLDELRAKGAPKLIVKGKELAGPYAKKLQALWIAGWNLGVIHNRTDAAMLAFIKGQTGIDHTRFLRDAADARKAVEALKSWVAREGGVVWGTSRGYDWLTNDAGKVAWAQWIKLEPGAELHPDDKGFRREVIRLVDGYPGQPLETLKPAEWRLVMNALGERIRARAGA
ncbi:regulatory protein GemA [Devosia sediminis]|uniref:Regulatory protein GemA n=1 Tax=Devosia sediminis TaxID=2798801 RepID=A0A934MKB9_9HYPH|nr:regulatory protein GemA [Devosia sediminis]MBJ3783391.1 regulatory protein GemA [Devosia sediminis]